ncbi:MFS transporter [Pseudonocardia spinosispora]|uniref:MFS transporter n=1 Tax=Pseudonocardia spinosispora TaxID=103441 RepID=UPI00040F67A4|nr:MFS transporter [Pseudonocardia spinosispora]
MPELSARRRILVLAICCCSLLVVGMDNTIVNVALPAMRRELHASVSGLQWTIDAYTLVLASFLMLAGSTADRVGRRRTFQVGLVSFGAGSLLCSLAPSIGWLIAARILQALGGSMLNPVAMSIITNTFTDRVERAKAIGVWGAVAGLSLGLGPVVGGALVDAAGWRSIFWINVPIVAVAVVLAAFFVPESKAPRPRRFDPIGQTLVTIVLGSVVYAIIEAPRLGWASAEVLGLFVLAVGAVAGILVVEPRRREPLLDLRFFRSLPFSGATVTAIAAYCGYGAFLFLNTLYLQDVRGMSALHAGLCTLPVAVLIVVLAPISGRIVGARGPRLPLVIAGGSQLLGALAFTWLTPGTPFLALIGIYVLFGITQGLINPPITNAAVSGMPSSMAGVAASCASTSRQTGTALGVAVAGSIVGSAASQGGAVFTSATHPVWWALVGLGACVLALGLLTTGRRAEASAARAALLFDEVPDGPSARASEQSAAAR